MGFPRTECDRLNDLIPYSQVWIAATGVFHAARLAPEIHPDCCIVVNCSIDYLVPNTLRTHSELILVSV